MDNKDYPSVSLLPGGELGRVYFYFLEDIWFVTKDAVR